ncbi:glycoside hydrolase TIM-barrel-like domain-containing protein [Neoehrlichia mikurensis]|uniref:Glycoside hydrolase TIM-barrel-like domain-containing protein n=1 Tax=Neoehrlichia mikurensis TaxID=89586 RepID=A0A9Q9BRR1_9RICK|nr:glycoside hydrolase TIM-barrel-like domain-containing protein [Neoehrlichia mikurensis]QXK92104.1 glycoside hydrolase TIM-barrel-like domain-containing protein [Neoehrlichia mikurensis]QXK92561.1 glycoside hydrolase TIM-barrel-like domain-containing protein [Neoehrlichia mikurensis]QXK93797.1 glycoside hydrolase TIM-barrel-like domain-containing protein [Neoehrlichia mikurensis]UTO55227.1 glycoside hydrolase TIM-barrel-like domain-containing protein [Neoehrlichia mikurensis]UTO56147.1 glyco
MSTLILSTIEEAFNKNITSTIGNFISEEIGNIISTDIDTKAFQFTKESYTQSTTLKNLNIQTSVYGKIIPIIYGTVRIAGNIIWMQPIKEINHDDIYITNNPTNSPSSHHVINHSYYATLAIAICYGPVKKISKIWANTKLLNLDEINYRFYNGTETQEPDPLILSIEKHAPAYRGISYIVIEDFFLKNYNNSIPNFTFEVISYPENFFNKHHITQKIENIHIMPGYGEFIYDTKIQMKIPVERIGKEYIPYGTAYRVNHNSNYNKSDAIVSLDQLKEDLPNIKWISIVVNWYTDSVNIKSCNIYPTVEFKNNAKIIPDDWKVANITRNNATVISRNNLIYGGTINDVSLIRYIHELKARGYKVLLYPKLLIDIKDKLNSNLVGEAKYVSNFFKNHYNPFITHYCTLAKDLIDAFIIGSGFSNITSIVDENKNYPAVDELIALAKYVKNFLGNSTIITYAANYDEYHSHNNFYNMDKLWASQYIDVIGINAYFPLTDTPQPEQGFTINDIIHAWNSGEGYEYFYLNKEKKFYINSEFSWKNIHYWWSHSHTNPDGNKTLWNPKMKKIWFTEYGFPSIDNCTSQPNIAIDNNPIFLNQHVNFAAQKNAIEGTIEAWKSSEMVDKMFLWGWDVRPYPIFPNMQNNWHDAKNWQTGYWIAGKITLITLADIIKDILQKINLHNHSFTIANLQNTVEGYTISSHQPVKFIFKDLQDIYRFNITEKNNKLIFAQDDYHNITKISLENMILNKNHSHNVLSIIKDTEFINKVNLFYISKQSNYQIKLKYSKSQHHFTNSIKTLHTTLVLDDTQAQSITDNILNSIASKECKFKFILPIKYIFLSISDIIEIIVNDTLYLLTIINIELDNLSILIEGCVIQQFINNNAYPSTRIHESTFDIINHIGNIDLKVLDLPCINNAIESSLYFAANRTESYWKGGIIYADNHEDAYSPVLYITHESITGIALNKLEIGPETIPDENSNMIILLKTGNLYSISNLSLLNGNNIALIGQEIIQFKNAQLIGDNKYKLTYLLRGRYGTEKYIYQHQSGDSFFLLSSLTHLKINTSLINKLLSYKAVSYGQIINDAKTVQYLYNAKSLKPLSVAHVNTVLDVNKNLHISWIRRARVNIQWLDNIDVPLDEQYEQYDIEIINNIGKIIRILTIANKTTFTYTKSQKIEDFGHSESQIQISIYQLSAIVGKGEGYIIKLYY